MPETPAIPGMTLVAGPFVSVFGTAGYLLYEGTGLQQPLAAAAPAGYDLWAGGTNAAGKAFALVRPAKVPDAPALPTDGTIVEPGQSWADALRTCPAGRAVYLRSGQTYPGPGLTDPDVRLADVRLDVWPHGEPRAVVRVPSGTALDLRGAQRLMLRGIRFTSETPTAPGLRFTSGCRDVVLEGCEIDGFTFGLTSEGDPTRNVNVTLNDCSIRDNYHPANQRSSGVFFSYTDGVVLTGNRFDQNGWNPGKSPGTGENHNAYLHATCGPAFVRGNVFSRSSSHGLQARSGGDVVDNWFIDNPIHLSFGLVNGEGPVVLGGVTGAIRGNTFVGTRMLAGSPRGWAIELGNVKAVEVVGNVFAYDGPSIDPKLGTFAAAVKVDRCDLLPTNPMKGKAVGVLSLTMRDNVGTGPAGATWVNPALGPVPLTGLQATPWPAADVAGCRAKAVERMR
jgi:hypothetical protein